MGASSKGRWLRDKDDFKQLMKKIDSTNPDIGLDVDNIVLKNPSTGITIETDVPIDGE